MDQAEVMRLLTQDQTIQMADYMEAAEVLQVAQALDRVQVEAAQSEYFGVQAVLSQVLMLAPQLINIIVHSKHINI